MSAAMLALSLILSPGQAIPARLSPQYSCSAADIRPTFAPGVLRSNQRGVTLPRTRRIKQPQYSAAAMREGVVGTVCLQALVQPDGSVGDVAVIRSLHPELDDAAMTAAREWTFYPSTKEDTPIPMAITIEMSFALGRR